MDYTKYRIMYLKLDFNNQALYNRLMEDMEYYLLDEKDKNKMLYYFEFNDAIFIMIKRSTNDTIWNLLQLQFLITNAIKKNRYILMGVDSYTGYHTTNLWDLFDRCEKFYDNTKETRKIISEELVLLNRTKKIKKIKLKIGK